MRVLQTIGEMDVGGAEALVVELAKRGHALGWHNAVASAGGVHEEALLRAGVAETYRVPLSRRTVSGLVRATLVTRRSIAVMDPDVVLAHNVGVTAAAAIAKRTLRRRIPVTTVFHGVAAADYNAAARILNLGSDEVVAVSEALARRLKDAGLKRRAVVIPNAVTPPPMIPREDARRELGLTTDVPMALCAARLVEQKRHDVLLRAWAMLPEECVLLIAGEGPQRDAIEHLREELSLTRSVRILGRRDDVPRLLAAADIATLSSDWEGLPIFVLEALASGRPVVATNVDGLTEVLADGGGVLVPPGSARDLAEGLRHLLLNQQARNEAAAMGRHVIERRYNPETMVRSYDELLRSGMPPVARAGGRAQ